jgi:hypothetical protein
MMGAFILPRARLLVDRSLTPVNGNIVVADYSGRRYGTTSKAHYGSSLVGGFIAQLLAFAPFFSVDRTSGSF